MRALAMIAAAVALAVPAVLASPAAHAADGPALALSKTTVTLGEYIEVTGSGFPIGAQLQVEICGIGGSSNSCAIAAAVTATADAHGGFRQKLAVVEPPTPCPCTVHAAPFAGAPVDPVDAPITIPGLRYLPHAAPAVAGTATLLDATAVPDSPFLTQFGAEGSARVTLTFGGFGGGPADDPGVALTLSRAGRQIGRYPVAWTGGVLPAGGRRSLVYELSLPGGWFRDYEIGVQIGRQMGMRTGTQVGAAAPPVTVRTLSAAVRPWGELGAPAALLAGLACLLTARRRRSGPVRGLPVRQGTVAGRRSGVAPSEPFAEAFSVVETAEVTENGSS